MIRVSAQDEKAQEIAWQVYDQLSEEQALRTTTSDILVEAQEGVVSLTGRVRTNAISHLAQRVGSTGLDGWILKNNLISDEALAFELADRLAADPRMADDNVRVDVFLGVATLRGWVPGLEQRDVAIEIASAVPGVVRVDDHLASVA
ncbi:MAG: BON domain-containing protein [Chloroflexota bacterium]|nr:BON domain-containing protein [Chloroflexota bacterium]